MELKEKLSAALKTAMKDNDVDSKRVIRMILSAIKNTEIDRGTVLTENEIISVIHKELKSRDEVIESARLNNRLDLISEAEKDKQILSGFLPEEMPKEELVAIIKKIITDLNAQSVNDMGKVMKIALPEVAGRAPGKVVSDLVKELLQSKE